MEKQPDIRIFIACHKPTYVPENPIFYPVQVGTALTEKRLEHMAYRDNEGDNISGKNPDYCELTAQYWAWKNIDCDYYGFFHYRRYLTFHRVCSVMASGRILGKRQHPYIELDSVWDDLTPYWMEAEWMVQQIAKYDLLTVYRERINTTVYRQYCQYHEAEELNHMLEIVNRVYPEYTDSAKAYMSSKDIYYMNMYIMKKELFHEYMSWLFDILFEFEKKADMSEYTVEGYRTPGHLAERLLTVFCWYTERKKNLRVKKLQTIIFLKTDQKMTLAQAKKTAPAFDANNVAIAVAANDYFIPYCATFLKSMAEHSNSDKNYDILLLSQDVSDINVKNVKKMLSAWKNISLRVLDPSVLIDQYTFHIEGHFSKETYYRLVLPELLPNYDKVLYLDSDMIAMDDVAKIYDENIDGYLLAACHDADTAGLYNGYRKDKKDYTDKILRLKEPYQYFQAGVLLLNLEEFRKRYTTKQILDFAVSEKWQLLDQDILNKLCEGAVKYIDMSWNVMVDFAGIRINQIIALAPRWLNEMYQEARKNPKIIHYAGPQKPWFEPEMDFGMQFWECARGTAYYEIMLGRMNRATGKTGNNNHKNIFRGAVQCVLDHGIVYTIGYIPKRVFRKKDNAAF